MRHPMLSFLLLLASPAIAAAQVTTAFTYQGELRDAGQPAAGAYDLRFRLFDALTDGAAAGPTLCADNIQVVDGRFVVELNFGAVFTGASRFLQIEVRPDNGQSCGDASGFTVLTPRQPLTATPYAAHALTAAAATTASNASLLNNQPATFYTNAANLTAGTIPDARLGANVSTLAGTQTFSGVKTFSAAPLFAAVGAPFSVASSSRITNLNADLLDGFDSAAFAASTHTHDASAITSGTLADARIASNIPRTAQTNIFTDTQVVNVSSQTPLTLIGSNTGGTWVNLQNTGGGRTWNLIATGSGNGEGPGRLLVRDQSGGAVRLAVDPSGRLGIGTASPSSLLELQQPDAALRVRNTNDTGGGFVINTFGSLQLGMFNPSASAWGAVPAASQRSMFGVQNTGRVGTLTNTGGAPTWRNTIDDGSGNATSASGFFSNNSVTLIENITVNVPASGFLRITARASIGLNAYDFRSSTAILELKETTNGEVAIKDSEWSISDGTATPSGATWRGDATLEHSAASSGAGTRSFKLRLLHNTPNGTNTVSYSGAEITVMYIPAGL